jgi:uncharacterized protein YoxC
MEETVFDDAFVSALADDNVEASLQVAERFRSFEKSLEAKKIQPRTAYHKYLEVYGFLLSLIEARQLRVTLKAPTYNADRDIGAIRNVIGTLDQEAKQETKRRDQRRTFEIARDHYPSLIPGMFSYEFLESDYKRLQALIDELRTLTTESSQIDPQHKGRLLKRVEKLQQELNKKMSNLDLFWGFLGEAGVALGKFGEDVKPLTDRICEILQIAARTEARANGLPAGKSTPLLKAVTEMAEPEN